jgi:1,4-dihydroxy-2-naphthoyl-CoA synthase
LQSVEVRFGFTHVVVDGFDGGFEEGELAHSVGNLAAPEGIEAFV